LEKKVSEITRIENEELPKVYCASDVVMVPSLWQDPCPTVVLEAMACGKPVISYNVGGTPEIIEDGVMGYLVRRGDKEMLAKKLLTCLSQPNLDFIALNSRKRIDKDFSYWSVCEKLSELYQTLRNDSCQCWSI